MNFVEDKYLHDTLRAHFQTVDVQNLNAILMECGVTDLQMRKRIRENYFFTAGQFFDAGWFEANGKYYSPIVCYREVGSDLKRGDTVICPDPEWWTNFHELAGGTAEMVSENPADPNVHVKTGEIK